MQSIKKRDLFNTKLFWAFVLLILVPFMLVSCGKKPVQKGMVVPVKTQEVQLEELESKTSYVATMFTRMSTEIKPRISGPIVRILVEDGAYVRKGDTIVTIEASEQLAASSSAKAKSESAGLNVKQAEASVKASVADVGAAISKLELAKIELDRYEKLYEKDSVTKADLDSYTNEYNQALANLTSSEETLKAQQKMLEAKKADFRESIENARQDKIIYDYYSIKAPFNGYVGSIPVKIGDYVDTNTVLTTITENNNLDIMFSVDLKERPFLKKGLIVRVDDNSGKDPVEAKIWFISPKVNSDTQTVMVKAFYANNDNRFDADQVLKVDLIWKKYQGIAIPMDAISRIAGQNYVFIVEKDDKGQQVAKQIPVSVGDIQNNKHVITDGLKPGDILISSGIQKLRDNVPVTIQK